ncbi:Tyrosinase [Dactylella cylindrospora]|nr:Tyrosinase [Dactylella cylindrospora]
MLSNSLIMRFLLLAALAISLTPLAASTPTGGYPPSPYGSNPYASRSCRRPLIRKEWRALTTKEKLSYLKAVQCMGDKRKAKSISGIPGLKTRYDDFQGVHSVQTPDIHWVGHFILWHRYYIATYEKTLRQLCGYNGAQPYWNWTIDNTSGLDMAKWPLFDNKTGFGGNGPYADGDNPFGVPERSGGGCVPKGPFAWPKWSVNLGPGASLAYNPRCLTRDFSRPMMAWGTTDLVNWVMNVSSYSEFAYRLENVPVFTIPNVHGAGHFGVGGALGALGDVYASPGDPIFYLHHATLDKMLWRWQQRCLPSRFFDVGGPVVPFDYQNLAGPDITLSFKIGLGKLAPNVTLGSIMNLQGDVLCYDYEG